VKISGYLLKKSSSIFGQYQKRFFMVTVTKAGEIYIAYFKTDVIIFYSILYLEIRRKT
jgi:hypothetical protein